MNSSKKNQTVLVLHGPNLNMLGMREPAIYGHETLDDINRNLIHRGKELGVEITTFQSNHEGELVDRIHKAVGKIDGLIINPGAFTHTSVAIRDAILLLNIPVAEIHLSNIYKRESFRHKSLLADIVTGQISGFGSVGYPLALEAIASILKIQMPGSG